MRPSVFCSKPLMSDLNDTADTRPDQRDAIRVTCGARLHFGLLSTTEPFGGVGVMIDQPATEIVLAPSIAFQCSGPHSHRVEAIVSRLVSLGQLSQRPLCEVRITQHDSQHCGFGSGTQLSMAVSEALAKFCEVNASPDRLALEIADRGRRSAVGIHGYRLGGMIYEDAVASNKPVDQQRTLNQVHERIELPESWRVLLIVPAYSSPRIHGEAEREQFEVVSGDDRKRSERLREILKGSLLPAARNADFGSFTAAVTQYNRESGLLFEAAQGGAYNGPEISKAVEQFTSMGALGIGQSSWGPGLFAWCESQRDAESMLRRVTEQIAVPLQSATIARVRNQPRDLWP